jgi:hypothetical protein
MVAEVAPWAAHENTYKKDEGSEKRGRRRDVDVGRMKNCTEAALAGRAGKEQWPGNDNEMVQ